MAFELHSASPHVGGASSAPLVFVENGGGMGHFLDWQSTFQGKLATKALYSSTPGVVSLASSILNHHHYLHHHRCSHHHNQQHWQEWQQLVWCTQEASDQQDTANTVKSNYHQWLCDKYIKAFASQLHLIVLTEARSHQTPLSSSVSHMQEGKLVYILPVATC